MPKFWMRAMKINTIPNMKMISELDLDNPLKMILVTINPNTVPKFVKELQIA